MTLLPKLILRNVLTPIMFYSVHICPQMSQQPAQPVLPQTQNFPTTSIEHYLIFYHPILSGQRSHTRQSPAVIATKWSLRKSQHLKARLCPRTGLNPDNSKTMEPIDALIIVFIMMSLLLLCAIIGLQLASSQAEEVSINLVTSNRSLTLAVPVATLDTTNEGKRGNARSAGNNAQVRL